MMGCLGLVLISVTMALVWVCCWYDLWGMGTLIPGKWMYVLVGVVLTRELFSVRSGCQGLFVQAN